MWEKRRETAENRKSRRLGRTRGKRNTEFLEFFGPYQEEYNRIKDKVEWKLRVAAVVERLPVVTPDMPQWESDYWQLRDYLDCFDKEYPEGNPFMAPHDEAAETRTYEDIIASLPEGLRPAPRETEADHSGYVHTLDRALKQRVYLTIPNTATASEEQSKMHWDFPTTDLKLDGSETLVDAAKRAVKDAVGSKLEVFAFGNAPIAFDYRLYPLRDDTDNAVQGEKIFYYRLQRDEGGAVVKNPKDCAWLTREEIVQGMMEALGERASRFHRYHLST